MGHKDNTHLPTIGQADFILGKVMGLWKLAKDTLFILLVTIQGPYWEKIMGFIGTEKLNFFLSVLIIKKKSTIEELWDYCKKLKMQYMLFNAVTTYG